MANAAAVAAGLTLLGSVALSPAAVGASASGRITLTVAMHSQAYTPAFSKLLDEYHQLHPNISFKVETVPFANYLNKILISHMSGNPPDMYYLYSLWGVQLERAGIISRPPASIADAVKSSYTRVAVHGVTLDHAIWGIPTEIDDYMLVYNKKLLAQAGYKTPPATWAQLLAMAKKLTRYGANGQITQYGFAFLAGWDSAVVHPYLALLYSNGGSYLTPGFKSCALNSPAAVQALQDEVALFSEKATNSSASVFNFPAGHIAMEIIFPSTFEPQFKAVLKNKFSATVGVAPIPRLKTHKTLVYTWFWGVDSQSQHKAADWAFLRWLNMHVSPSTHTTLMGYYLVHQVAAMPSNRVDLASGMVQKDPFLRAFASDLPHAVPEPNVDYGEEIKTILMNHIEAAWFGKESPKQALARACAEIDPILRQNYP